MVMRAGFLNVLAVLLMNGDKEDYTRTRERELITKLRTGTESICRSSMPLRVNARMITHETLSSRQMRVHITHTHHQVCTKDWL